MTIPVFGDKVENVKFKSRYGVHAIVEKNGNFCLVQAPNGAFFLPGGEIEPGESQEEALKRELIEEIGADDVIVGDFIGQANEYFYSSHRDQHYYNPAYFYSLNSFNINKAPLEDFNKVLWFTYDEAVKLLKRGSHKWGLEAWKTKQINY